MAFSGFLSAFLNPGQTRLPPAGLDGKRGGVQGRVQGGKQAAYPLLQQKRRRKTDHDPLQVVREMSGLNRALLQSSMAGAKKTALQRQRILDVVRMEREIHEAARQNGAHARATADRTEQVAEDTERGHQTLEETTRSLQEMALTVDHTAAMMGQFVASMAEVNLMVEAISHIARQTNLLAINAAIEAAHAARHGDSFSVIAQEIRVLADRAGIAATDITEKIGSMTASTSQAAEALRAGRTAAETSIAKNLEVQSSFRAIRETVQQVKVMSAAVADGSDRQIHAGDAVLLGMNEVDSLAGECTQEADASTEISIGMLSRTRQLMHVLRPVRAAAAREANSEQEASEDDLLNDRGHVVARAMQMLRQHTNTAGPAALFGQMEIEGRSVPALYFGSQAAAAATGWVDDVHQRARCSATVFFKHGQEFVRVVTSVRRPDGQRAVGTVLNPRGLAIEQLLQGRPYQGAVYVLGKPFFAEYEPVFDSAGQVVGALYVGRPVG